MMYISICTILDHSFILIGCIGPTISPHDTYENSKTANNAYRWSVSQRLQTIDQINYRNPG